MTALTVKELHSLERYDRIRPEFRAKVTQHKDSRRVPLGEHAALYFADTLTMQFELTPEMVAAAKRGAGLRAGIDPPALSG